MVTHSQPGAVAAERVGLIVNPVAGIGGRVGLKGSDGADVVARAMALGAVPEAPGRAIAALEALARRIPTAELLTYGSSMGEAAARAAGFQPIVVGSPASGVTTPADTRAAALALAAAGVDLLLFAGGDGTARDIHAAVGGRLPVLGIPAGVKIHSAAFGVTPRAAGELAALFVSGRVTELRDAEVMDIDEEAFRMGRVSAALYGYLRVPADAARTQSMKAGRIESDAAAQQQLVYRLVDEMVPDDLYVIGPGTTTNAITAHLGLGGTLLGVDVVRNRAIVGADVSETQLLEILAGQPAGSAWIVVTIIGGQGYLFGRGNQQISPRVIARVGRSRIRVLATPLKVATLGGQPLLVDTGDPVLDEALAGHIRVAVGYNQDLVMRVASPAA